MRCTILLDRQISPTADWNRTANGALVKSNSGHGFESATTDTTTTTTEEDNATTAMLRRHSLPINSNGCAVAVPNGNTPHKASNGNDVEDDDEEEEDEMSETAALTSSSTKNSSSAITESQL